MNNEKYLKEIMDKYNINKEDSTLTENEKVLLKKISEMAASVDATIQKLNQLNAEAERVSVDLTMKKGYFQGLIDSLVSLRGGRDGK